MNLTEIAGIIMGALPVALLVISALQVLGDFWGKVYLLGLLLAAAIVIWRGGDESGGERAWELVKRK